MPGLTGRVMDHLQDDEFMELIRYVNRGHGLYTQHTSPDHRTAEALRQAVRELEQFRVDQPAFGRVAIREFGRPERVRERRQGAVQRYQIAIAASRAGGPVKPQPLNQAGSASQGRGQAYTSPHQR